MGTGLYGPIGITGVEPRISGASSLARSNPWGLVSTRFGGVPQAYPIGATIPGPGIPAIGTIRDAARLGLPAGAGAAATAATGGILDAALAAGPVAGTLGLLAYGTAQQLSGQNDQFVNGLDALGNTTPGGTAWGARQQMVNATGYGPLPVMVPDYTQRVNVPGGDTAPTDEQAPTGFGPSWAGAFPDVDIAGSIGDYARQYYETAYGQVDDEFNKQLGRLNEDYGDTIGEMNSILDDYRQGRIDADTAYDEYQKRSAAILSAAITAPVDPVQTEVANAVNEEYARAGGALGELAATLDAGGPPERFGQALAEIRTFQDVMVEAVRNEVMSIEEVHHAAAEVATALAKSAYADDQYKSEYAQEELGIQITSAIDKQLDQIRLAQEAWDKAKRRMAEDRTDAYGNIPDYEIDEDFFYNEGLKEWAAAMGFDQAEIDVISAKGLEAWTSAAGDMNIYGQEITNLVNEYNMGSMDILDKFEILVGLVGEADPLLANDMAELMRTKSFAESSTTFLTYVARGIRAVVDSRTDPTAGYVEPFPGFNELGMKLVLDIRGAPSFEGLWGSSTPIVQALKQYGAFRKDFEAEIRAEREAQAARDRSTYHTGRQAPDNARNKDKPDYVYRRNVLIPDFAKDFRAKFGWKQSNGRSTIGGYQWIRPDDGRGAANSDHLSGGALDLYADTEADRRRIAAWARTDPRVSMVIYEGDDDHEGHHVHVSLKVGYRI